MTEVFEQIDQVTIAYSRKSTDFGSNHNISGTCNVLNQNQLILIDL